MRFGVGTVMVVLGSAALQAADRGDGVGGGPNRFGPQQRAGCSAEHHIAALHDSVGRYRALLGKRSPRSQSGSAAPFTFVPLAGTLYDDVHPTNFVDLDPGPGVRDFICHNPALTYDGHDGIDLAIRSFAAQDVGVPIFAAADGIVVETHDGEADRSTELTDKPVNFVVIDHGDDRYVYYLHMRRGSVAVGAGDTVRAGEQIGEVGSSGFSDAPHLHFSTYDGFEVFEPFSGACRAGASGWASQPSLDLTVRAWDIGVTPQDIGAVAEWPEPLPVGGQLGVEDSRIYVWVQLESLPLGSVHRLWFERPDGTVAYEYGPAAFDAEEFFASSWWWWWFDIADLHTLTGTWHFVVEVNGATVARAPFSVLSSRSLALNHAPAAVTVSLDPPTPGPSDVLFCRVNTSPILDDADFDFVRYEYVWTVDGAEVRRVTSGGHADALALGTLSGGDVVVCTVTPSDGTASGPSASVHVVVAEEETVDDAAEDDPDAITDNANDNTSVDDDNDNDNLENENDNAEAPPDNVNDNVLATEDVSVNSEAVDGAGPPPGVGSRACGAGMVPMLLFGWTLTRGQRRETPVASAPGSDPRMHHPAG